ncbi:MAG: G-D-S-L family lipolytic protein [Gammaproteobacteria bacterium]|nr:G-D-S-L family lipolytic protein [Gammaproteobacteria bacterium]MDH3856668.1 G-D-S-L family lipolytic protein [Gammaproteobacteria bacterium]
MKIVKSKTLLVLAMVSLVAGCDTDISGSSGEDPSAGSADFTTFVALGDSLTAGYADGALYLHGQENSLPLILSQQFALTGGGAFTQPLMPVGGTGSLTHTAVDLGRADRLVLVPTGNPSQPVAPDTITPVQSTAIDARVGNGGFNNMGVPGAKAIHLAVANYGANSLAAFIAGTSNPYFARFSLNDTTTMIADFLAQAPTFFVLWIGNNDILLYAVDGGPGNANPPYGTTTTDVSDPTLFNAAYNGAVAAITGTFPDSKGVLATIPDIATIPYFTTVPYNPIPMDATTAALSNGAYAAYNAGIASTPISPAEIAQRTIVFAAGQNALVIEDDSLTTVIGLPSIRQATANDLIILTSSPKIGTEAVMGDPTTIWGVGTAMLDADVLTEAEIGYIETARTAYNATIVAAANADPDLLLFDAAAKLTELNATGIIYGSGGVSSTFAQGGAYSLDGIHPTARGYAVIANEIFKVINEGFDAFIPPVDPNQYTTVFYQ